MFIRAAKTHTANGKPVYSYHLVISQRIGDTVRRRTLLNLGTNYPVPREKWKQVTDLAEALLLGHPPLLEAAPDVQDAAEDIVTRLTARGFHAEALREHGPGPDVATVDLDSLAHENPRSVGCERLCLKALDDLHSKEWRAEGHLFISVLAYQCVQALRMRMRRSGCHDSWGQCGPSCSHCHGPRPASGGPTVAPFMSDKPPSPNPTRSRSTPAWGSLHPRGA